MAVEDDVCQRQPFARQSVALGDLVGRQTGDVLTFEPHFPGTDRRDVGDGLEERRLAGSVGAEEGDELAALDGDGDVEQNLDAAVAEVEVAGVLQYRFQNETGVKAGLDLGLGVRYYF